MTSAYLTPFSIWLYQRYTTFHLLMLLQLVILSLCPEPDQCRHKFFSIFQHLSFSISKSLSLPIIFPLLKTTAFNSFSLLSLHVAVIYQPPKQPPSQTLAPGFIISPLLTFPTTSDLTLDDFSFHAQSMLDLFNGYLKNQANIVFYEC